MSAEFSFTTRTGRKTSLNFLGCLVKVGAFRACSKSLRGGQESGFGQLCCVAKPLHGPSYGCVLRLAAHPKPLLAHPRRDFEQALRVAGRLQLGKSKKLPRQRCLAAVLCIPFEEACCPLVQEIEQPLGDPEYKFSFNVALSGADQEQIELVAALSLICHKLSKARA
ncbi:hypothetical protein [Vandammella animalimorsus]|uniref:hypothetical protein n=1 Tax=Vandammella animalimorsus TaxID=2029117 RepID=UPI0011788A21|nr:hypothetical protein [Vandammella animalimorsus]